jgi:predicted nucleic acid-binding protein
LAARIRATTSVRTPDALQLATAMLTNCTAFLTNDGRLRAIGGIKVLRLHEFVADAR